MPTRTSIRHRQQERLVMLLLEVLVLEFGAVDGFTTGASHNSISNLPHQP